MLVNDPGCGGFEGCGACGAIRGVFYCCKCVQRGDFVYSTATLPERYADKQLKLMRCKSYCRDIEKIYNELPRLKKLKRKEELEININISNKRIEILKSAICQSKDRLSQCNAKSNILKDANDQLLRDIPCIKNNVETLKEAVSDKRKFANEQWQTFLSVQEQLHNLRKTRLKQLVDYVFPIGEAKKNRIFCSGIGTERALAEASRPVKFDIITDLAPIQILSASLPLGSDYSVYCHWVSANKGLASSSSNSTNAESISQNEAYRLSAALAYSTQLIRIIAFYLDVRLPFNINYNDLCSSEMDERHFKRQVKKLQSCAAVLVNRVNTKKIRGRPGNFSREPPLHILLRLCPPEPRREFQENDNESFLSEDDGEDLTFEGLRRDGDGSSAPTSDEEEPEQLQWDADAVEPKVASDSPNLNTGLASSILKYIGWNSK